MRPATLALIDQARAAARDAGHRFTTAATASGAEPALAPIVGGLAVVLERLRALVEIGDVRRCSHISRTAPSTWRPSSPTWLLCDECRDDVTDAIQGTVAERLCDACSVPSDEITVAEALLPAVVVDEGDRHPPAASGPVTVHARLCGHCAPTETTR